ncbi:MAG TPA: rod shape-determining protein MreD [Gaiellaceae bacterium]|nr:rod shape-determining protein MreD [Gaiellaceae bacterium]
MTLADGLKTAGLVTLAVLLQLMFVSEVEVASGHPDLVLVVLVVVALQRGSVVGAVAGFWAGLLLDVATFEALGLTSLLLTLAGYGAGRLGQTMSKTSPHPPLIAVGLATVGVLLGSAFLHFVLGSTVAASTLFGRVLLPTLALNLLLAWPVHRLVRRLFPPTARERREVSVAV